VVIATGLFFGWYNNKVVPVNPSQQAHYTSASHDPLKFMSDWDGPDYIHIARYGYSLPNANFFPLYPLLIRCLKVVLGSYLISALLISWLCFMGSIYFYIKIIKNLYKIKSNLEALRGVAFFILFPTGVFLLATYTESLFAFLALGSIYFALTRRWQIASLFALFCTATHITGAFVLILIALILLEEGGKIKNVIASLIIGSFGIIGYMTFLGVKFSKPLSFLTSQKSHGWLQHGYGNFFSSLNIISVLLMVMLAVTVVYWWPKRKSFSIYTLLFLLIPFVGKELGGFNRYVLMAFPFQIMVFELLRSRKTAYSFILAFTVIFWTYFLLQYAGGYVGG
jgi:hypothetical protein